jgi:hypothetical protein
MLDRLLLYFRVKLIYFPLRVHLGSLPKERRLRSEPCRALYVQQPCSNPGEYPEML